MIHSKAKTPDEVFAFCDAFRKDDPKTPLVVVPTTYNLTTEDELPAHGVNIVIHANPLIRSAGDSGARPQPRSRPVLHVD